jgi:hypothetical protein
MLEFVVDTHILVVASNLSDEQAREGHRQLVSRFKECSVLFLVVDEGGHIESEYNERMRFGSIGQELVRHLALNGRLSRYPWRPDWRALRIALGSFDKGDHKFVRTAIASKSKRLVAEEAHWSDRICDILRKREGVRVHRVEAACDLCANLEP